MNLTSVKWNDEAGAELSALLSGSEKVSELANDLAALKASTPGSIARWTSRPAVLRRVAMMLADRIPPEATRVIASGEGGTVLATAVALTAGLTFAVFEREVLTFGEAHAGEDVALVAIVDADLAPLLAWCEQNGIVVRHSQAVFGAGHGSLFTADEHGHITEDAVA